MSKAQTTYRKKMIEVALPLEAINVASAREKSIRHGHPSTLHLWWARRPLAACRAVLFTSLVNDPGDDPIYKADPEIEATERAKLFNLIEELVLWENSNNPDVINRARLEIARSIAANKVADKEWAEDKPMVKDAPALPDEQAKYLPEPPKEYTANQVRWKMPDLTAEQVNHFLAHYAPPVLDPFAGGGSIPLEAQRLGLRAYASDLNPVPVLINKALIEIPPKFAGQPPVNPEYQALPEAKRNAKVWKGAEGLAEDVRYYGKWMRDEAEKRIGHLYPKVKVTQQMVDDGRPDLEPYVGQELTVIAWLWARTVKSPNPAFATTKVPLVSRYWLSKKKGAEAFVRPQIDRNLCTYSFQVHVGTPNDDFDPETGTKSGRATFECIYSGAVINGAYIDAEAEAGELSSTPFAVAVQLGSRRTYLSPNMCGFDTGEQAPADSPDQQTRGTFAGNAQGRYYGLKSFSDYFTNRQLHLLDTYSQLVAEVKPKIATNTDNACYADAVATYLAFGFSKTADYNNSLVSWIVQRNQARSLFSKQAIAMVWDFCEVNPFVGAAGDFEVSLAGITKVLERFDSNLVGTVLQQNATSGHSISDAVVSTDPPYYDNISYSDLADFFYVWLRKGLGDTYPSLLSTMLTPKTEELIASPYRHNGSREGAKRFFETGLGQAIDSMRCASQPGYPTTIFYAFKQSELDESGNVSTGWETFLTGIVASGMLITGTWPMRTERGARTVGIGANALASSIILVCRHRPTGASMVTRRDFANALRKELPEAIKHLQSGNVAPVDLAQASIGPGMAVFSRYSKVVNADGSPMSVREALQLINQILDEALAEQESEFDVDTRFALRWFDQYQMTEGAFGDAETLSKAMAVSVSGVVESGILKSGAGKVRLLKREELADDWDPTTDPRLTIWEVTQHLIRQLEEAGESGASRLLAKVGTANGEIARDLAYRMYQTCERKSLAKEAGSYNALVVSWPEITKLARQAQPPKPQEQKEMFE